ncbi:cupin domain-containing protein [Catellatospora bangladeshensis]|uniref:cupin domain-containing protein n=1 Tax=Catellatospora bangladeshensis TaxID=310355 RepID=UPI00360EF479
MADRAHHAAGGAAAVHPGGRARDDRRDRVPPGDPGTPPHRHSGPAFGYVIEGEMLLEVEGEPERVVRAGEAFWEPGGDVIHYQDGNHRDDVRLRFTVTMLCEPGKPMLTLVDEEELVQRRDRRAPRPS